MTKDGVAYDGFTFTFRDNTVPSPMLLTMYINAMGVEVKARLLLDFGSLRPAGEYAESLDQASGSAAGAEKTTASGMEGAAKKASGLLLHSGAALPAAVLLELVLGGAGCAAGCSCTSCCPTGDRPHVAAGRRPA